MPSIVHSGDPDVAVIGSIKPDNVNSELGTKKFKDVFCLLEEEFSLLELW
jgi:hypothetical protein